MREPLLLAVEREVRLRGLGDEVHGVAADLQGFGVGGGVGRGEAELVAEDVTNSRRLAHDDARRRLYGREREDALGLVRLVLDHVFGACAVSGIVTREPMTPGR